MNLAVYIPLAGSLCNIFFALFVFAQAPKALANRVYLLLGTVHRHLEYRQLQAVRRHECTMKRSFGPGWFSSA